MHIDAFRVAAGHERGSGWCADAAGDIEACEFDSFSGHAVEVWRAVDFGAEAAEVTVAEVVAEDDDKVWFVDLTGPGVGRGHGRRPAAADHRRAGTGAKQANKLTACDSFFHL